MSAEEEDSEKQFEASQKKLDDARQKGEIPRSGDLLTAASYAGFILTALALGSSSLMSLGVSLSSLLDHAVDTADVAFGGAQSPIMGGTIWAVFTSTIAWFAIPGGLVLVVVFALQAIVFAPSKLAPKLTRISLVSGLKNKFGRQGIFEFVKSAAKLFIFGAIAAFFLMFQFDRILGSLYLMPILIVMEMGRILVQLLLIMLIIALILGGIDYLWQRGEHLRKNRMSRKEVMDEMKQSEGDPMMKQQRRQKGMSIAMNQMLSDVPNANVIVVNPTHFAVALKWDRTSRGAPVCLAKGQDEIAARIRNIAMLNEIPIHSDPPTARLLYATVEVGQEIASGQYRAVAAAIRFAEAIRKKARH